MTLNQHFAYQAAVGECNVVQRCGLERCDVQPQGECSKCRGLFCTGHLQKRDVRMRDGTTVRGSVCLHCHKRSKLWLRR